MPDKNGHEQTGLIPVNLHEYEVIVRKDLVESGELTVENKKTWIQQQVVSKMPELTKALFEGWMLAAKNGDSKAMRDMAEAIGVLDPKSGIQVNTQINNNNNVSSGPSGPSIESIIRKMDEDRYKKRDEAIIDAEIIEEDDRGKR